MASDLNFFPIRKSSLAKMQLINLRIDSTNRFVSEGNQVEREVLVDLSSLCEKGLLRFYLDSREESESGTPIITKTVEREKIPRIRKDPRVR